MTLREIIAAHPGLFYRGNRAWWDAEAFVDVTATHVGPVLVSSVLPEGAPTYTAADLALSYVTDPASGVWRTFMWTHDVDSEGNAVYVAGVGRMGVAGFQLHRHLAKPDVYWPRAA